MRSLFPLIVILAVTGLLVGASVPLVAASLIGPSLPVLASPLNPAGAAYEINPGPGGALWVSDNAAGEIRRYSADGSQLTIYSGLGAVSDARPASASLVWYVDQSARTLGQLDTSGKTLVTRPLPAGTGSGSGTALDALGRVWISSFTNPVLARFDPLDKTMCALGYAALASWGSPYLVFDGASLWFSDLFGAALLRLDPLSNKLTRWAPPAGWDFEAEGLAGDGAGGLWFTDASTASLGHLNLADPEAPVLERYSLPAGAGLPARLTLWEAEVWYAGITPGTLGLLNPAAAAVQTYTPQESFTTLSPVCDTPVASQPEPVQVETLTPSWTPAAYDTSTPAAGWTTVPLETDAYPLGVVYQDGVLWSIDNGQQVILRAPLYVSIEACKLADADGSPATTADQTPLAGWDMTLWVDGAPLDTRPTAGDGCASWDQLAVGSTYQVTEASRSGWRALTPTDCPLGLLAEPGFHTCRFINSEIQRLYLPFAQR